MNKRLSMAGIGHLIHPSDRPIDWDQLLDFHRLKRERGIKVTAACEPLNIFERFTLDCLIYAEEFDERTSCMPRYRSTSSNRGRSAEWCIKALVTAIHLTNDPYRREAYSAKLRTIKKHADEEWASRTARKALDYAERGDKLLFYEEHFNWREAEATLEGFPLALRMAGSEGEREKLVEARRRLRALLNEQTREARRYKARMRRPR